MPSGKAPAAFMVSLWSTAREDLADEVFVDGQSGAAVANGAGADRRAAESRSMDPAALGEEETIVVPPEQRASAIVRQLLAKMLRPLQADAVHEESLAIDGARALLPADRRVRVPLAAKDRRGVVEVDALTGEARDGARRCTMQITRIVSRDALFDIGADTVGLLVPGGSIAVKLARVALDRWY